MNVIVSRTKEVDTCILWEPFATSTPVKTVSVNTKFKNDLQLVTKIDSNNFGGLPCKGFNPSNNFQRRSAESKHLSSKMVKKSNLCLHKKPSIDLCSSSSDDDSNENKKRPIIKLSTKKNTKSFINNRKPENEDFQEKDDSSIKINVSFKNKKKNAIADLTPKKDRIQKVKNKTKNNSENLKADPRAISLIINENGRIFDGSRGIKNSESEIKQSLENINHSKNDEKFKDLSNVIKNEGTGLKEIVEKSEHKYNKVHYGLRNQKKLLKATTENYNMSKPHVKGISITNDVEHAKNTSTKKAKAKSAIQSVNLENHAVENKMNLSHQLFSDIKEQEFINSLDLRSEEINDSIGNVKSPLWQKQKTLPYKQLHQTNQSKGVFKDEEEQKRPKRRRQGPKQFWLPQNTLDETLQNKQRTCSKPKGNPDVLNTNNGQVSKLYSVIKSKEQDTLAKEHEENNQESNKVTENLSKRAPRAGRKRKKENLPEEKNSCPPEDILITGSNEKKLKNIEVNCMFSSGLNVKIDKEVEPNKVPVKDAALEKEEVFKHLAELSFNKSEMGCSTVQCWNINHFKCGVFKLKAESEVTSKTLHRNSYLGGVLVKGTLKMKIQDRELELKEGDMAFVPPLTEWQATNIGKCEAVFYYWCGRFK